MKNKETKVMDVRALLAEGVEPFPFIRKELDELASGATLVVVAPFLPAPLIELMREEGFEVRTARGRDAVWETSFRKK